MQVHQRGGGTFPHDVPRCPLPLPPFPPEDGSPAAGSFPTIQACPGTLLLPRVRSCQSFIKHKGCLTPWLFDALSVLCVLTLAANLQATP